MRWHREPYRRHLLRQLGSSSGSYCTPGPPGRKARSRTAHREFKMPSHLRLSAVARSRVTSSCAPVATSIRHVRGALPRVLGIAAESVAGRPPSHIRLQVRGKKTKTTVSFDALPQGLLLGPELVRGPLQGPDVAAVEPLPEEEGESGPAYPTVVMQARRNMNKYDNCVLLTRVGGFYELYFEHAEGYGPLLNLKVAQKKTGAGPVPMVMNAVAFRCRFFALDSSSDRCLC